MKRYADLARDRGTRLAEHEFAQQKIFEQSLDVEVGRQVPERSRPEDAADHGSALEERLAVGREVVDTRGDERLQRVGDAVRVAALDEHADGLLDEQRVALGAVEQALGQRRRFREVGDDRGDELFALRLGERLELDGGRPNAPSSPPGTDVEEVGPGEAEDEQRRPHPVGKVLDEVEHRLLGPVDVLEEEDERLHVAERVHHLARCPGDLLGATLAFDGFQQARGQADEVCDRVVLAALAKLLECLLERLVVGDPDRRLDHLCERPVRDAFAVRQAAALEHACAVHRVDELAGQPALADSRLAVDREDVRAAVAQRSLVRVLKQLQLGLAADERRTEVDVRLVDRAENAPGAHRGAHALELERPRVLHEQPSASEAVRGRADENLARHRCLLEAGREVHGFSRGERRVRLVDDDLAGLDADAHLEVQFANCLPHPQRRPRRPLGVVLVAPAGCRTPRARRLPRTSRRCRRAR